MGFSNLLEKVMNSDSFVRYAVVLNSEGNVVEQRIKKGIENFLPAEQMEQSFKHAKNAWKFRNSLIEFLGNSKYVLAVYDNVRRLTVPIDSEHLLLVVIDNKGGQKDVVDRVLAILSGDYTKQISSGPQG
jgi:hypothetical protein